MAVKPGQTISRTDQIWLTEGKWFCLALDLGQQSVEWHEQGVWIMRVVSVCMSGEDFST